MKKNFSIWQPPSPWRQCGTFSLCKSSSANSHPSCKTNAPPSPTPEPQNKNEKAFQERKWPQRRETAATVTRLTLVLSVRLLQIKSKYHRLMINNMSFISSRLRSYRWLSASVLCFSLSRQTRSTKCQTERGMFSHILVINSKSAY